MPGAFCPAAVTAPSGAGRCGLRGTRIRHDGQGQAPSGPGPPSPGLRGSPRAASSRTTPSSDSLVPRYLNPAPALHQTFSAPPRPPITRFPPQRPTGLSSSELGLQNGDVVQAQLSVSVPMGSKRSTHPHRRQGCNPAASRQEGKKGMNSSRPDAWGSHYNINSPSHYNINSSEDRKGKNLTQLKGKETQLHGLRCVLISGRRNSLWQGQFALQSPTHIRSGKRQKSKEQRKCMKQTVA